MIRFLTTMVLLFAMTASVWSGSLRSNTAQILMDTRMLWVELIEKEDHTSKTAYADAVRFDYLLAYRCEIERIVYLINDGIEREIPFSPCKDTDIVPLPYSTSTDTLYSPGTVETITILIYLKGARKPLANR